jgi:hypothetical protein
MASTTYVGDPPTPYVTTTIGIDDPPTPYVITYPQESRTDPPSVYVDKSFPWATSCNNVIYSYGIPQELTNERATTSVDVHSPG